MTYGLPVFMMGVGTLINWRFAEYLNNYPRDGFNTIAEPMQPEYWLIPGVLTLLSYMHARSETKKRNSNGKASELESLLIAGIVGLGTELGALHATGVIEPGPTTLEQSYISQTE